MGGCCCCCSKGPPEAAKREQGGSKNGEAVIASQPKKRAAGKASKVDASSEDGKEASEAAPLPSKLVFGSRDGEDEDGLPDVRPILLRAASSANNDADRGRAMKALLLYDRATAEGASPEDRRGALEMLAEGCPVEAVRRRAAGSPEAALAAAVLAAAGAAAGGREPAAEAVLLTLMRRLPNKAERDEGSEIVVEEDEADEIVRILDGLSVKSKAVGDDASVAGAREEVGRSQPVPAWVDPASNPQAQFKASLSSQSPSAPISTSSNGFNYGSNAQSNPFRHIPNVASNFRASNINSSSNLRANNINNYTNTRFSPNSNNNSSFRAANTNLNNITNSNYSSNAFKQAAPLDNDRPSPFTLPGFVTRIVGPGRLPPSARSRHLIQPGKRLTREAAVDVSSRRMGLPSNTVFEICGILGGSLRLISGRKVETMHCDRVGQAWKTHPQGRCYAIFLKNGHLMYGETYTTKHQNNSRQPMRT